MKHTVRAFSIGLITAGLLLLGIYYFMDLPENNQAEISPEEMIARIEAEGYHVLTEEEYISYSVSGTVSEEEEDTSAETDEDEEEVEEEKEDQTDEEDEVEDSDEREESADEEEANEPEQEQEEEQEEDTPQTVTIQIESGMASSQISRMLENEGLIEDAEAFNQYLQEHDYSLRVQLGEHELVTGMSHYEIAEELTN
jgi:outer membrane biosynthesis protein TonB